MVQQIPLETYKDINNDKYIIKDYYLTLRNSSIPKDQYTQKVTYNDLPDLGYITLAATLYSITLPDFVFFVNTSNIKYMPPTKWLEDSISILTETGSDIVYGGKTQYQGIDCGIGLAVINSALLRELLYYTNLNSFTMPPLLILSLLNQKNEDFHYTYNLFDGIKLNQNYDYITEISIPHYQKCANINDTSNPTIALLLPQFKRDYIYDFIWDYNNQSLLPEFYCLVQCENRIELNLNLIRSRASRPVYHIWGYNWSPLFLFPLYVSSFFPVDFVMRWDDDQAPLNGAIQKGFVQRIRDKDTIIGMAGLRDLRINCGKWMGKVKQCEECDHVAVPLMYRPFHAKLAARLRPYTFAFGEDVALAVSSRMICKTKTRRKLFLTKQYQEDQKNQMNDEKLSKLPDNNKGDKVIGLYCHYRMNGGYVPTCQTNETHFTKSDAYKKLEYEHTEYF
ncbi:hypothetical protein GPJ56_000044 [Histomonas meleagridis]|uniref:uncharacterized protein n=1 Tax=Histomonas meleagridis TaxID=135588 RepID=UPI00355A1725|nr:hypothetical protein GPJ56_000044 [Histomonas meleagridis]KAH0805542.1 hypothetical protein GO595_001597 [Histomonas meleagridis]